MKRWIIVTLLIIFSITNAYAYNTMERRWIDAARKTYGEKAAKRVEEWRTALNRYKPLPTRLKLKQVNNFINQMYFVSDADLWGKSDYWATPIEFIGARGGDCEDFTIAKYFSLLDIGVSDSKLRLVYVKAIKLNQFHMVLAYYEKPDAEPLILDNLIPQIRPADKRTDLLPIYSFNGKHLWLMKAKNGQLAGDSSRLSRWSKLRERERALILNKPIMSYDE